MSSVLVQLIVYTVITQHVKDTKFGHLADYSREDVSDFLDSTKNV